MDRIKKGLSIFAFFFKIGCFTFGGGWAILAQMEQEFVDKRQIITKSELLEMVAVGKSAPGIMITNISLLFGYHVAGVFGGLCAVFGIITPAVIILSIVTLFYNSRPVPWQRCSPHTAGCRHLPRGILPVAVCGSQ